MTRTKFLRYAGQDGLLRRFQTASASLIGVLTILSAAPGAGAQSPSWQFQPKRFGAVLAEGGWALDLSLGAVNGSPEFDFPLQLVYDSTRTQRGGFGGQWYCPQLESHLLPKERGLLVWTLPSGGALGLYGDEKSTRLKDRGGEWVAKVTGALITISNADGWEYSYRSGRLLAVQSPTRRQLEFVYTGSHLQQVILRDLASGMVRVLITIGEADEHTAEIVVGGIKHTFSYEPGRDGHLAAWMRSGQTAPDRFAYTKEGVLSSVLPGAGERLDFKTQFNKPKDAHGQRILNPLEKTRPANYWLIEDPSHKYSYPQDGKDAESLRPMPITLTDQAGGKQTFDISMNRGIETNKDPAGNEFKTLYYRAPGKAHDGKLRRIVKNDQVLVENYYDPSTGALIESRDTDGIATYYEYEAPRRQEATLYAAGGSTEALTLHPKPVRVLRGSRTDRKLIAAMKYDAAGHLIDQTDATGQTTRFAYNSRGELETVTAPSGERSAISRDAFGRVTGVSEGGQKSGVQYDEAGRVKSKKAGDGQETEFFYNTASRLEAVKQNGVIVSRFRRDAQGRVTEEEDALHRIKKQEYDTDGNVTAELLPNGAATHYEYDTLGHRTAQIDGNGNRVTFTYDSAGHLIRQDGPLHQTLTWKFDAKGRLQERTNGVQHIRYTYDDAGRVTKLDYGAPGEKLLYTYDAAGRIKKIATPANCVTYFYDSVNRIVAKQFVRPGHDRVIRYAFTAASQKAAVTLSEKVEAPAGSSRSAEAKSVATPAQYAVLQQTEYAYDARGRLAELKSNGRSVCRYQYDTAGRLQTRIYGDGITGKYSYDKFGRQTRLELTGGPLADPLLLAYGWDDAGQMTWRTWNGETQAYSYDGAGQLRTVSKVVAIPMNAEEKPGFTKISNPPVADDGAHPLAKLEILESYQYDPAGNMLEKFELGSKTVMAYNAANQLISSTIDGKKTAFAYDTAGRLISEAEAASPTKRLTYGFLDKVLTVTRPDGARVAFDYYPDGQLAAKAPLKSGKAPLKSPPTADKKSGLDRITDLVVGESEDADLVPNENQAALNAHLGEELVWDDLALLWRNGVGFAMEPHVSGGAPAASSPAPTAPLTYYISDILGTTLAGIYPDHVEIVRVTAFGKPVKAVPPQNKSIPELQKAGIETNTKKQTEKQP